MQLATKPVFLALVTADSIALGALAWLACDIRDVPNFASWLNGQGGRTLMPLMTAKFTMMAIMLAKLRIHFAAAGWFWIAIAKAVGLHLAAGHSLSDQMTPMAQTLALPPVWLGKMAAMAAIAMIAAGLFGLGWSGSVRAREQAQLGLSGIVAFAIVSALPEILAHLLPTGLAALAIATELVGETIVTSAMFWLVMVMATSTTTAGVPSQTRHCPQPMRQS